MEEEPEPVSGRGACGTAALPDSRWLDEVEDDFFVAGGVKAADGARYVRKTASHVCMYDDAREFGSASFS